MRVISGKYRGRVLRAPKGLATRPTAVRVREALFSVLGDLSGLQLVDCYAGTGALGLEALSRGAGSVVFVESGKEAARVIQQNLETLGIRENATLVRASVAHAAKRLQQLGPFDLVLADPPWPVAGQAAIELARLFAELLPEGALMVLGHPVRAPLSLPDELPFELTQMRSWGDSAMTWFTKTNPTSSRPE